MEELLETTEKAKNVRKVADLVVEVMEGILFNQSLCAGADQGPCSTSVSLIKMVSMYTHFQLCVYIYKRHLYINDISLNQGTGIIWEIKTRESKTYALELSQSLGLF